MLEFIKKNKVIVIAVVAGLGFIFKDKIKAILGK